MTKIPGMHEPTGVNHTHNSLRVYRTVYKSQEILTDNNLDINHRRGIISLRRRAGS